MNRWVQPLVLRLQAMKAETSSLKLVQLASLREKHSWHHVIKCRAVVEHENKVKSCKHTQIHTQSSTMVIIIGSERDTIRDNTKNQGYILLYISYMLGRMYVTFVLWLSHFLCSLVTLVNNALLVITVHTWKSIAQHAKLHTMFLC